MFKGDKSLKNIEFGNNFITSEVTDMSELFYDCHQLKNINLNTFDASNILNMRNIFYNCIRLTSIDVSKFSTSKF